MSFELHHECTGRKEIGLDIGSIKPWQTVLVGAVGLLALGKPVTGGKRFPDDLTLTLPGLKNRGLAQVGQFRKEKKTKDYACWCQLREKPSTISGCPA